jgi:uncharacterized membrane protein YesL
MISLFWEILVTAFYELLFLAAVNLLWLLLSLPLVTAPGAAAGLYYVTNELAHGREVRWPVFFTGFRRYFWLGWRWALVNLVFVGAAYANLRFYEQFSGWWVVWVERLFLGLLSGWLLLQVYVLPLLIEQQDRRQLTALRNSAVLYLRRPTASLLLLALLAVVVTLSLAAPVLWALITPALIAFLCNATMVKLVDSLLDKRP